MTALDRARAWFLAPAPPARATAQADSPTVGAGPERHASAGPGTTARAPIGSAVVLGRPGHAEPVAAAVALALAQSSQSRAATVAVIACAQPATAPVDATRAESGAGCDDPERSTAGGTRAARRLAARLEAHGLPAHPRGRLVWVGLPEAHRQAAARRAVLIGAPAVLAITAPRTGEIEELLSEQDLLVLAVADPTGPLARIAALAPGGVPIAVSRPLPRGLARSLALAGICAPRAMRELLASAAMPGATVRAAT
jgi:hypothetical protein